MRQYKYFLMSNIISISLAIVILFLIFTKNYICPFYTIFNIPCPGCGMTRAFKALLKLDFKSAFNYHCLFPIPIIYALYIIYRRKYKQNLKFESFLLVLSITCFIFRWITILILYY